MRTFGDDEDAPEQEERDWDRREVAAFDAQDRLTGRVARRTLVFVPVWLVLLLAVPQLGMKPMPALAVATILAVLVVVGVELSVFGPIRRRYGEQAIDVGLLGRAMFIGALVWTFVIAMPAGPESPWLAILLATVISAAVVVAVEVAVVRPLRRRRAGAGR